MSTFRFKRFSIVNDRSSMKVNTDGVLLGAAVSLRPADSAVLDVGTGTGTIALMLAQRYADGGTVPSIEGIDIDKDSAEEASANFGASPWSGSLRAEHCALSAFRAEKEYDLIVSNPPYFVDSLLPPEERRSLARHASGDALTFKELAEFAAAHLTPGGRLAVVLPYDSVTSVLRYAASYGLYLTRMLKIRTTPRKPVTRMIVEFSPGKPLDAVEETLTIQDSASFPDNVNGYTPEYIGLTRDFYLYFP